MRSNINLQRIEQLLKALGRDAHGPGCIYFTGGVSALLIGWRRSIVDIDIRLDPESAGVFQAIAKLKQELNVNIELASPQDFLPPLPGLRVTSLPKRKSVSGILDSYRAKSSEVRSPQRVKTPEPMSWGRHSYLVTP